MKKAVKKIVKEMPPFKQILSRIQQMEDKLMKKLETVESENEFLKGVVEQQEKKIMLLNKELKIWEEQFAELKIQDQIDQVNVRITNLGVEQQVKRLDTRCNNITHHMNYLHFKGLHPEFYEAALMDWFYHKTGTHLDLKNPQTYNEKIQWLKLYDSTPLKTRLVDKYLVRDWIAEKIGEDYLIPLLGAWDSFDEINFDNLPQKFVLKANHGSTWNLIVKNKKEMDYQQAKVRFDGWMGRNFAYYNGLELQYLNIPKKIIAEEYLEALEKVSDYRFLCFDGEVKIVWLDTYPTSGRCLTFFTRNWEKMDIKTHYPIEERDIPMPKNYDKMLEIATKLSQGFAHVRVDLYNVDGKIYFGEMTFSSTSGILSIEPKEFESVMGSWIKLPEKKRPPRLAEGIF